MRYVLAAFVASLMFACGQSPESDTGDERTDLSGVPNGDFVMSIALAPVGNLVVPFKIALTPGQNEAGDRVFTEAIVYATNSDFELSDALQTLNDVAIEADGSFDFAFNLTVPGAYTPTMSDVTIESTLSGRFEASDFFCGDVIGQITTFDMDLAGSTFGAVPWEDKENGFAASCDDDPNATIPRLALEDCPALKDGTNTGFPSGGLDREFEIQLPLKHSDGQEWPIVFAWHGFGGTAKGFMAGDLAQSAAMRDIILVVPQGAEVNGQTSFDPFGAENRNLDVAFFDDMLTCVANQFGGDLDKVYSTGMSNGGLMTGALIARRASKLAAAAPLSGGIGVAFAEDHTPIPTLITWGGPQDFAYEQDFHRLAQNMIDALDERNHFMVTCEHDLEHAIPEGAWDWVFEFLTTHDRSGGNSSPYEAGIGESFPSYCAIPGGAK